MEFSGRSKELLDRCIHAMTARRELKSDKNMLLYDNYSSILKGAKLAMRLGEKHRELEAWAEGCQDLFGKLNVAPLKEEEAITAGVNIKKWVGLGLRKECSKGESPLGAVSHAKKKRRSLQG